MFENAIAVAKHTILSRQHQHFTGFKIKRMQRMKKIGYLTAIGADVLDRCGTDTTGYQR